MPIYSKKNLYPGINPHLNSALQRTGSNWVQFHNKYLTYLEDLLEPLLSGSDYFVGIVQSLQISKFDAGTGEMAGAPRRIEPDALIARGGSPTQPALSGSASQPTLTMPLRAALEIDPDFLASVVIYRIAGDHPDQTPVTRIEFLSRANKPNGSHFYTYMENRRQTLHSGVCLVELDYLHETRPILEAIPAYVDQADGAYPYHIAVSDPRPTLDDGRLDVYGFGVLDPLPTIPLPLYGEDTVTVDFNALYQRTFESNRLFYATHVDYAQEPLRFKSCTPADRERIRAHMAQIAAEHASEE